MPLDLYRTLRMVEEEIAAMKQRQQTVVSTYQQQTRDDIAKKFDAADHALLEVAERKIKEINSIAPGSPYLVTGTRKVAHISVRRVQDESSMTVEIAPIIYPTAYNLKFVLGEPSIGLYSQSETKGTFSVNAATPIRGTDLIEPLSQEDIDQYVDLWITHKTTEDFANKLKAMGAKLRGVDDSAELVVESLLMMSSPPPPRQLIYYCEEHEGDPSHGHDRTVATSAVKGLVRHHLKLS